MKEQLEELKKIPKSEWAKAWCDFNRWDIPEKLAHLKPAWWGGKERDKKINFIRPFMKIIVEEVGEKACSREWNRKRMTDEEHEEFWYSNERM